MEYKFSLEDFRERMMMKLNADEEQAEKYLNAFLELLQENPAVKNYSCIDDLCSFEVEGAYNDLQVHFTPDCIENVPLHEVKYVLSKLQLTVKQAKDFIFVTKVFFWEILNDALYELGRIIFSAERKRIEITLDRELNRAESLLLYYGMLNENVIDYLNDDDDIRFPYIPHCEGAYYPAFDYRAAARKGISIE